tara:strand:+ start:1112 stop:1672 length:561 start_codon:yes stop_codon:yes gene_type:complete
MIVLHHNWGALHIGYGIKKSPSWYELDSFFHTTFMSFMIANRGFYPLFDIWLTQRHQDFETVITMFDGHADHKDQRWMMCADGPYDRPVQEFVDEHDGESLLIFLLTCNSRNQGRVTSKNSLVVHCRSSMSVTTMLGGRSRQILHIPGRGDFIGTTDEAKLADIARELGYGPTVGIRNDHAAQQLA